MRRAALVLCAAVLAATASGAAASCRQALALGLDVSGSVDGSEYRLQMDGLAAALEDREVRAALLARPSAPVNIAVYEWSGQDHQHLLLGWTAIGDADALNTVVARLRATKRHAATPNTALGTAMQTGLSLLAQRPDCWKRTLDVSGDGKHNSGPHPRDVRAAMEDPTLTINALVIGADDQGSGDIRQVEISELSSYFNAYVIAGPDAFVETALGFEDYREAMIRKLKRELESPALSLLAPPARPLATVLMQATNPRAAKAITLPTTRRIP